MGSKSNCSLTILAEICTNLPYLAIDTPKQSQPLKRPASSSPCKVVYKKYRIIEQRTKVNMSLQSLFDQEIMEHKAESNLPATSLTPEPQISPSNSFAPTTSPLSMPSS